MENTDLLRNPGFIEALFPFSCAGGLSTVACAIAQDWTSRSFYFAYLYDVFSFCASGVLRLC